MVSSEQHEWTASTAHVSGIELAVRRALRRRPSMLAVGALGLVSVACALPVAAEVAADAPEGTASSSTPVEEILVTARRKAIESADDRKKLSESIIDSVNADDAGKLPDASITEVLQRVPGVTIERWGNPDHFSAQGTGIQVRGLSGVAGRINGREVFSASGGTGLSWSDIPPELMAGVDVYKAATSDLIEGGSGGQVDLRTKMPFDFKQLSIQLSGNADYADFRSKAVPTGSALIADTWDTEPIGRIGLVVDLAYGKYASRADFMAVEPYYKTLVGGANRYIPGGFDYGRDTYDRTRKGAYAAVQWQPTDNLELAQTYFESKYAQASVGQSVFMDTKTLSANPNGNNVFDSSGGLLKSDSLFLYDPANLGVPSGTFSASGTSGIATYSSDTRDLSTTFKLGSNSGRWNLRGAFQAVDATSHNFSYDVFPNIPFSTNGFGMDMSGVAQVTMPSSTQADLGDPTQYSYGATMDHLADNDAKLRAGNLDFDFTLSDSGLFRSFQAGARYADHTETDQTSGYNWTALCAGWNGCDPVTFAQGRPGDYQAAVFDNFFRGQTRLPGNVLLPSMAMASRADVIGDHAIYGNGNQTHGIEYQPGDRADVKFTDEALYGLIRFADDKGLFGIPYKGNIGARLVRMKHQARGAYVQQSGSYTDPTTNTTYTLETGNPVPLAGGRTDTRLLPSVNLQLVPNEHWTTRFSYTDTMDMPSVVDMQANGTLGITTVSVPGSGSAPGYNVLSGWKVTFGNPELRPVVAHNFDLSLEWYPKPGSAAHVDLFYKALENWLEYNSTSQLWPIVYNTAAGDVTQNVPISYNSVSNATREARIKGVEVGGHTYFDFLPGPLRGFGIDANYTLIDSSNPGDIYYDISGLPHNDVPIVGMSRHNFNAALLYDYKMWSARLAYSWRSDYLLSTNANGTNGDYVYYSASTPVGTNCLNPSVTSCHYTKIALPVWSGAYGQLDFGVTLRPSDHYYFAFQVANLGNTISKSFQGGYPGGRYPRNWFVSDRHFNLTVGVKF